MMPTIGVQRDLLFKILGKTYSKAVCHVRESVWSVLLHVLLCS